MDDAVIRKTQDYLVYRWQEIETHIQIDTNFLTVVTEDELSQRSLNVQSWSRKSSSLLCSRKTNGLVVCSSSKRSTASVNIAKSPRKASSLEDTEIPTEGPSSGNDSIDVD